MLKGEWRQHNNDSSSDDSESEQEDSDLDDQETVASEGSATQVEGGGIEHTKLEVAIPRQNQDDSNRPPTPWASSKAKQNIISELSDSSSDIHLLIGKYTVDNFKEVNFTQIREKYANNKYKASNFRANVKRLLGHLLDGTGPFEEKKESTEQWYTSPSNVSAGYALLFLLHMDPQKSQVVSVMTDEQLWESYPEFKRYEFDKFKEYNKNMKKLTDKRKGRISREEASFHRDMGKLPQKAITARGYPFWNNHPASNLLEKDERDGTANRMKPTKLWESRPEYQVFPLSVFRKHIYQERMKQIAAPYWQHKRNKTAKKKFEETQEMMKDWEDIQAKKGMEGLLGDWGRLNLGDNNV